MTPEQAATRVLASLWVQYGFLAICLIMGYIMLRENKKDKELIRKEKKEQEVELATVIKEVREESRQAQAELIRRSDEHSKELLAVNERSNLLHEKNNQIVGKFVDIADECSKTRACKADQIQAQGQGGN